MSARTSAYIKKRLTIILKIFNPSELLFSKISSCQHLPYNLSFTKHYNSTPELEIVEDKETNLQKISSAETEIKDAIVEGSLTYNLYESINEYSEFGEIFDNKCKLLWQKQLNGASFENSQKVVFEALLCFQDKFSEYDLRFTKTTNNFRKMNFNSPLVQAVFLRKFNDFHSVKLFTNTLSIEPNLELDLFQLVFFSLLRWQDLSSESINLWLNRILFLQCVDHPSKLPRKFLLRSFKLISEFHSHLVIEKYGEWFTTPCNESLRCLLRVYFKAVQFESQTIFASNESLHFRRLIEQVLLFKTEIFKARPSLEVCELLFFYYSMNYPDDCLIPWFKETIRFKIHISSFTINKIICHLISQGLWDLSYQFFSLVQEDFSKIDYRCYVSAINALIDSREQTPIAMPMIMNIYHRFTKVYDDCNSVDSEGKVYGKTTQYYANLCMFNVLLKFGLATRNLPFANDIILKMMNHKIGIVGCRITYHMLIRECARAHNTRKMEDLFHQMVDIYHMMPTERIYFYMINCYIELGRKEQAYRHFSDMEDIFQIMPSKELYALLQLDPRRCQEIG